MKSTLSKKVGVAIGLAAFFGVPFFAQAQYGPPSGYEGMTPPAGYEDMMPPSGFPTDGQMGLPADVQEKMNKGLQRLKATAANMQRAIKAMERAVEGVTAVGYSAPGEVLTSIERAKAAVELVQRATEFGDAEMSAIDDFNAFGDTLNTHLESLMLLSKFPRIMKGADRAYARLTKFFEDTVRRLANSPIDLTENIAGAKAKVDALKGAYDKAQELAKSGKAEEAFDELENNFFPGLEDASQAIGLLNAAKGISRASAAMTRGLKTAQKIVDRLVREGIDADPAQAIVDETSAKFVEFKGLVATKDFDLEKAMAYLEDMEALREDFMDKVDALVGDKDVGKLPNVKFFGGTPNIPLPMDMRKGFDGFQAKVLKQGGIKSGETPSDSFGIGPDMMEEFQGYGF